MLDSTQWKLDAAQDAIGLFTELGYSDDIHFPANAEIQGRMELLNRHRSQFHRERRESLAPLEELTITRAGGSAPYDDLLAPLLKAAMMNTPGVVDAVEESLERLETRLAGQYLAAFQRRNAAALRSVISKALDDLGEVARANVVDVGLQTLEAATRAGCSEQWLALEKVGAAVARIRKCVQDVSKEGFLKDTGLLPRSTVDGKSVEQLLKDVPDGGAPGVHFAASVVAGVKLQLVVGDEWVEHSRQARAQSQIELARKQRQARLQRDALTERAEGDFTHPKPASA